MACLRVNQEQVPILVLKACRINMIEILRPRIQITWVPISVFLAVNLLTLNFLLHFFHGILVENLNKKKECQRGLKNVIIKNFFGHLKKSTKKGPSL